MSSAAAALPLNPVVLDDDTDRPPQIRRVSLGAVEPQLAALVGAQGPIEESTRPHRLLQVVEMEEDEDGYMVGTRRLYLSAGREQPDPGPTSPAPSPDPGGPGPCSGGDHGDPYEPEPAGDTDDVSWPSDGPQQLAAVPALPTVEDRARQRAADSLRDLAARAALAPVPALPTAEEREATRAGSVFADHAAGAMLPEIPDLPEPLPPPAPLPPPPEPLQIPGWIPPYLGEGKP